MTLQGTPPSVLKHSQERDSVNTVMMKPYNINITLIEKLPII